MPISNASNMLITCYQPTQVGKVSTEREIYNFLNCSKLPTLIAALIIFLNCFCIVVSHLFRKLFWCTSINSFCALTLPSLVIAILFFPLKSYFVLHPNSPISTIAVFQLFTQTAFDGLQLTVLLITFDLIMLIRKPSLYVNVWYRIAVTCQLTCTWLIDLIYNYIYIGGMMEYELISLFKLNSFPATIDFGNMSVFIGTVSIVLCTFMLIIFCKKRNDPTDVIARNISFVFPLFQVNLFFIILRFIPKMVNRYMSDPVLGPDYYILNIFAFTEWFCLMLPPVILLFNSNFFQYCMNRRQWNQYEEL